MSESQLKGPTPGGVLQLQIGLPPQVVSAGWSEDQWVEFLCLQATTAIKQRVAEMLTLRADDPLVPRRR